MPTMARRSSCVAARMLTALAALAITRRSLHVNPLGRDLDDHPRLVGPESPELPPGVHACELFDVLVSPFHDQLGAAPDRQRAPIRTLGVDDGDRDPVVTMQVASLEAGKRGVEVDVFAVGLDPDDSGLRAAIGHYGRDRGEVKTVEKAHLICGKLDHADIVPGHG